MTGLAGSRRYAIFVDAGAAIASGSAASFGRVLPRRQVGFDPADLVAALRSEAETMVPDSELLRLYWYDGSPDRLPTERQARLAKLPDLKLRLGRISGGGQKGVDGLLMLDLITLSLRDAITDAVVVTGDEDMLDAIEAAQEHGVRVHLLATRVPDPRMGHKTAEALIAVADRVQWLGPDFWTKLFSTPEKKRLEPDADRPPVRHGLVRDFAEEFVGSWMASADLSAQAEVQEGRPFIPSDIDRLLLKGAAERLGWLDEPTKRALREAFWETLDA